MNPSQQIIIVVPTLAKSSNCLTTPLHASANAAFYCFECLVEAGLANQVGEKQNVFADGVVFHEVHHLLV